MRTPSGTHRALSTLMRVGLFVVALACYFGILVVRQGPPSTGDTAPLTAVTTLLSKGELHAAAHVVSLPNPPGYALLTAPLVVLFRPLIGAPTWCTTSQRADAPARPTDISGRRFPPGTGPRAFSGFWPGWCWWPAPGACCGPPAALDGHRKQPS
jgi:hypothetical protein